MRSIKKGFAKKEKSGLIKAIAKRLGRVAQIAGTGFSYSVTGVNV